MALRVASHTLAAPHSGETVASFAAELRKSTETLLEQLRAAGVEKTCAEDPLSDSDKQKLLGYLQASHSTGTADRKRITLVKRSSPSEEPSTADAKRNPVILVGGLGRIAYANADNFGRTLLDAYEDLVRTLYSSGLGAFGEDAFDRRYREACRRMAEMLKQLRTLVKRVLRPFEGAVHEPVDVARRGGAFFHALKVDGRNLP